MKVLISNLCIVLALSASVFSQSCLLLTATSVCGSDYLDFPVQFSSVSAFDATVNQLSNFMATYVTSDYGCLNSDSGYPTRWALTYTCSKLVRNAITSGCTVGTTQKSRPAGPGLCTDQCTQSMQTLQTLFSTTSLCPAATTTQQSNRQLQITQMTSFCKDSGNYTVTQASCENGIKSERNTCGWANLKAAYIYCQSYTGTDSFSTSCCKTASASYFQSITSTTTIAAGLTAGTNALSTPTVEATGLGTGVIAGIIVTVVVILLSIGAFGFLYIRRRRSLGDGDDLKQQPRNLTESLSRFTFRGMNNQQINTSMYPPAPYAKDSMYMDNKSASPNRFDNQRDFAMGGLGPYGANRYDTLDSPLPKPDAFVSPKPNPEPYRSPQMQQQQNDAYRPPQPQKMDAYRSPQQQNQQLDSRSPRLQTQQIDANRSPQSQNQKSDAYRSPQIDSHRSIPAQANDYRSPKLQSRLPEVSIMPNTPQMSQEVMQREMNQMGENPNVIEGANGELFDLSQAVLLKVIHPYEPTIPDELPLFIGSEVLLLQEYDDGWALGILASGQQGAFPVVCTALPQDIPANFFEELSTSTEYNNNTIMPTSVERHPTVNSVRLSNRNSSSGRISLDRMNLPLGGLPQLLSPLELGGHSFRFSRELGIGSATAGKSPLSASSLANPSLDMDGERSSTPPPPSSPAPTSVLVPAPVTRTSAAPVSLRQSVMVRAAAGDRAGDRATLGVSRQFNARFPSYAPSYDAGLDDELPDISQEELAAALDDMPPMTPL
ncbi:hypothetical protein HK096_007645 [Nowakowskiella sp. JEL0078]|nr:hypothetical protein HK096_007645 [Nowakowskiella sp. JEL0078]